MTISGGGIREDAMEIVQRMLDEERVKEGLDSQDEKRLHRIVRQEDHTLRIMQEAWGREWMWEFVINAPITSVNPYTRNADTYHILGEQRQAKLILNYLKELDFGLYQLMELEARNRKLRDEEE